MLNPGTFIQNRYEIISEIGSGGMADVYKAKDHKLNRYVAIKVLKNEFRDDKEFISKFRAEAQSAAGLAHANIVNVYDVGEEAGINYFVMELVEGITLKQYIANKGRLSVREATSISLQICAGLEAAHNNGIIHRDVKPQNIMISTDGKVKVTDFGIARAASTNTTTSGMMGSVHYTSPEQARGGYSDEKSDIYSLGITMYEMLTGHVPFDGDTAVSVALQHLQEEMHGPKEEVPEIPYSTNQIVLKCTQKSPDRRYSNMADLIQDLRESLVNPDGDFVKIPSPDRTSQTIVMSRDEMDQLKSEQRMPAYDESLNVGAAANMNPQEDESVRNRAYSPGSYYQKSQYQEISPGRTDDDYDGSRFNAGYEDSSQEYDPYYDAYDDPNDYVIPRDNPEASPSDSAKKEKEEDYGMNPKVERAVTVGGTVVAVAVGCVFLALVANAFGLFNFGGGNKAETETLVEATEKSTEKSTEEQTEKQTEKQTENDSAKEAEAAGAFKLDDLSNTEQSQAQAFLLTKGLKPQVESENSDTVASGYVISTSPAAGADVSEGDAVTVYVSRGSEEDISSDEEEEEEEADENTSYVDLWDLTGYTLERAEEALSMLGLNEDIVYQSSDEYSSGMVISTSAVDSGGEVPSGSTVTLYVSTGP